MALSGKAEKTLRELPDKPGCYIMRDRGGRIIYVGKAASLRKRVQSYFRRSTYRSAPPKLRSLINGIADLEIVVVRNEAEAVLTEGRLIKDYKPRYNVSFRDDKRFLLLRAKPAEPCPRFRLCRIRREDGAWYFGPYASSQAARATLDFVEKRFGIRKCAPREPDAEAYRHCINDIVRFCAAPCIGKVSLDDYRARFEEACAFLRGERVAVLKELRAVMEEAAAAMRFERAAALRDTLLLLQETIRQRARVAPSPAMRREEALKGVQELAQVLELPAEPRAIEAYDISTISGTYSVASMVCFVDGMPQRNRYRRFRIRSVEGVDDPRMIGEVVGRRFAALVREGGALPQLVLIDGGPTQLKAARASLASLGLSQVPVTALAKRFEDVYRDESGTPMHLARNSPALKVLQRLRDEAHRFALTYHRRLRGQRIRESAIEDVPGIGAKRKQQILSHFGSVRRVAVASETDIAAVPGIGIATARLIKQKLAGE